MMHDFKNMDCMIAISNLYCLLILFITESFILVLDSVDGFCTGKPSSDEEHLFCYNICSYL